MKKALITILLLANLQWVYSQNIQYDSLKNLIRSAKDDSTRFYTTASMIWGYLYSNQDSAALYLQQNILLAKKMNSDAALDMAYGQYWTLETLNGNYSGALQYTLQSLRAAEQKNDFISISATCFALSELYGETGDFEKGISYLWKAKSLLESKLNPVFEQEKNEDIANHYIFCLTNFAQTFERFNQLDSALKYANNARDLCLKRYGSNNTFYSRILALIMGNIYSKTGDYSTALNYYRSGAAIAGRDDVKKDIMDNYSGAAITFKKMGQLDSSIFYANKVLEFSKMVRNIPVKLDALNLLADVYKLRHNTDSVAKYLALTIETKDSLFNKRKVMEIQSMTFSEELRQRELKDQEQQYQNRLRTYLLAGGLLVVLLLAGILYRNNLQKQKAKVKIEKAYEELKSTQAQLIQSEKMASLGELTAGIAHEIQNPLNFVNNFSEVNKELLVEMNEEMDKGNIADAKAIAKDVIENEEKITHHGKRADAIVKGMLQHSRASSGHKEPTDINALAEEYLRLSYHGLRAKDKSFNATLQTDFDPAIGKINIIPQDIGRVILNLITNAFYAVAEKNKLQPKQEDGRVTSPVGGEYEPIVSVSTKMLISPATSGGRGVVEIRVRDNGMGIPQKLLDKIFQPFFTTKPTGQGTGLGLSLSYDIIKAHGGELKVETKEGEFAEFIIHLPLL
jgi:two-component system, NtrC family, sensor kinase